MGPNAKRRERLLERKVFKNRNDWSFDNCFERIFFAILLIAFFVVLVILADGYRSSWPSGGDVDMVAWPILLIFFYILALAISVIVTSEKVPEKYFKLCSVLAILHSFLILFLVCHSFQTFVPGPRTEKLKEMFKFSLYATFVWIPALIISLFSCAIILWKASDQSELYTVILDGERSSTKLVDVSYEVWTFDDGK